MKAKSTLIVKMLVNASFGKLDNKKSIIIRTKLLFFIQYTNYIKMIRVVFELVSL